jgi:3-hydroxymyristoyl/3-hydroxydecanoyl-(acyl carrier protein) dehydratase
VLRHRPPVLLVDAVTAWEPGAWLEASWRPDPAWPVLAGHFPGDPIVPGVLLVEALAQASGILVWTTAPYPAETSRMYLTTIERARFLAPARPGETLALRVELLDRREPLWRFAGSVRRAEEAVADARWTAALIRGEART